MSNRAAIREYVNGSLWVLPMGSGLLALLVGYAVSLMNVGPDSWLAPLAYQGTAGDARDLLSNVTSTVVTVIALVLGLTVVALQLSSTQFSPRLVRNFLRDRPNQIALSVFVATFAYCAAGLYTVGEADREGAGEFPRLAVSGSIALLFASLAMVVFFADHLAHSLQVDAIGARVERDTLHVVHDRLGSTESVTPTPPPWAVRLIATESGYVQTVRPEALLAVAVKHRVKVLLRVRVGEHLVAGTDGGVDVDRHRRRGISRIRRCSVIHCNRQSASASNAPWSRTPPSGFGNWSTWPARHCRPRSTIPTPRCRPSTG